MSPTFTQFYILQKRANFLRENPHEQKTPTELEQLLKYIRMMAQSESTTRHCFLFHRFSQIIQGRTQGQNSNLAQQQQQQQHQIQPPLTNGHGPPLTNGSATSIASGPIPNQPFPPASQTPVSFTPDQIGALRAQIHAFKLITRGLPVPENIQKAIRVPNNAISELETLLQGSDVPSRVVDAAVKVAKGEPVASTSAIHATPEASIKAEESEIETVTYNPADLPKGPFLEDNVNSGIYPYNAYRHPFSHLKRSPETDPTLFATRLQRLLVPTIMPAGLDAHQILNERDRFIEARIQQRIRELETMPSTMGDGGFDNGFDPEESMKEDKENDNSTSLQRQDNNHNHFSSLIHPSPTAHGKIRALIELKSLRVLDKQRSMRALVAERLNHGSMLPLNRLDFRRTRKPTIRDARMTEQAERKQRVDRERRAKHKHVEQLGVICHHGLEVLRTNRAAQDRIARLGRSVLNFHAHTEKEEQKRIERISKERLRALKADDEEAYMKLIDTGHPNHPFAAPGRRLFGLSRPSCCRLAE